MRHQQTKARNQRLRVPRPYANPTTFGHLTTMDHSLAMDDLSRGLRDEIARAFFATGQHIP
eukprot:3873334-Pyramimonas_sp.AAC.1